MHTRFLVRHTLALAALGCLAAPNAAHAQVVLNIFQNRAEVDALATGTLNITGLINSGTTASANDQVVGVVAYALVGSNSTSYDVYTGMFTTGPVSFGSGSGTFATSGSGDRFGIFGGVSFLFLPQGYVSGTPINGSAVFTNNTLSGLGLTPGTYVYTLPNDTVSVLIGTAPAAVPEPGTIALLTGLSLTGAAFLRRRKTGPQSRLIATHKRSKRPTLIPSPPVNSGRRAFAWFVRGASSTESKLENRA